MRSSSPLPSPKTLPSGHDACGTGFLADRQGRSRFDLLPLALTALGRMDHRGAVGPDGETGDGAGVLTAIPWALLVAEAGNGIEAEMAEDGCGVGSLFLPRNDTARARCVALVQDALRDAGLDALAWRKVPTNDAVLGRLGSHSKPALAQIVVSRPADEGDEAYERHLFRARREIDARVRAEGVEDFYVASLSHRTIVYKALLRGSQLADFFVDLKSRLFRTPFAVFHNRFSTNTHPSWPRTQPFRLLAHNGEINTIDGNRRNMEARGLQGFTRTLGLSGTLGLSEEAARPLLPPGESDSASLDEALSLLISCGHSTLEAMAMLIPPAWENDRDMASKLRAFYEGAEALMEPWDGPALVPFSDGRLVGAVLDRNGLRPARTVRTSDGLVMVASEAGVLDVSQDRIAERGRLGPGGFLAVDLERGQVIDREALDAQLTRSPIAASALPRATQTDNASLDPGIRRTSLRTLAAFGCTREELQFVVGPLAREVEPVGSMGDDTALACLSERPRLLFSFFKQRFAQVTNPPIDPLREQMVMSLRTSLDGRQSRFPSVARSPLLSEGGLRQLEQDPNGESASLSILFCVQDDPEARAMERALERVLFAAVREARAGAARIILSDRGVDGAHAAIPSLLVVSAVHQRLILEGLRLDTRLIVETGEARDEHHIAALLAFGANAVCPYGVYEATRVFVEDIDRQGDPQTAIQNVVRALEKGLLKILSKMGISTLRSYQGAQLFEIVGLDSDFVDRYFLGTSHTLDGHGLLEITRDVLDRHRAAFRGPFTGLEEGSAHRYRRNGESHAYAPTVVKALHALIKSGETLDTRTYSALVEQRPPIAVRDLLRLRLRDAVGGAMAIADVESAHSIVKRFSTAAMSLGSLSPEAHGALAIAMNRMGARSNGGEGGEAPENYWRDFPGGDNANHKIKQVASARFGVTTDYLVSAEELQIKIAQGSKPGEGGQLPGRKVVAHIARVRHSPEGATLISPPPHHDIYSIEDLSQLIHDLRRVNPAASVSVKLVSTSGIGAISAGVVKAGADTIVIGGHDGGTGASPLSSIKNAGTPWELGLREVQETLVDHGLRGRVRLRVEGGLKTGRDVVIGAALGADEFAFGSAALVATGCVMARQCHLNTCPAGIATQQVALRRQFRGRPEQAIRFLTAIAEEAREILASMGRRSLEDVVGDLSVLEARVLPGGSRASRVSAAGLLETHPSRSRVISRHTESRNNVVPIPTGPDDAALARLTRIHGHVAPLRLSRPITVADRSVGARLAGELARELRGRRLTEGTLDLHFRGSAGQSFGAFAIEGMSLTLEGEANDSVGKGLSGGEIVIRPRHAARPSRPRQVIAGNALLYGATSGRLFAAGSVGERFAVRLSGAIAVVEGAGDHACEYMTAGTVAILGPVGRNFGAGMSGGVAYVYDPDNQLASRLNREMVEANDILSAEDEAWVEAACRRHWALTESSIAKAMIEDWRASVASFKRVTPRGVDIARPVAWPIPRRAEDVVAAWGLAPSETPFPPFRERRRPVPTAFSAGRV